MERTREDLEKEMIDEKIRFSRLWVNHILHSKNKEWSSEQKKFIDALFENHRKNRTLTERAK